MLFFCIHVNNMSLFSEILSFFIFYNHLENNGPYLILVMTILKLSQIIFSVKQNKVCMYLDSLYKMNILACFSSYHHPHIFLSLLLVLPDFMNIVALSMLF